MNTEYQHCSSDKIYHHKFNILRLVIFKKNIIFNKKDLVKLFLKTGQNLIKNNLPYSPDSFTASFNDARSVNKVYTLILFKEKNKSSSLNYSQSAVG